MKKDSETEFYYEAGMKAARDKVGHCLREAMSERYARAKPVLNKPVPNQFPKPLACLTPRNDAGIQAQTCIQSSPGVAVIFGNTMVDAVPSIVSEADHHESSSQDDDDFSNVSAESLITPSICISNMFSTRTASAIAASDVVDALYELPSQGEWEQLILPRAGFANKGISDLVAV